MRTVLIVLVCLIGFQSCRNKADSNTPGQETIVVVGDKSKFYGEDYIIDDQHSYLGFKIKYFGHSPVRGRFDKFKGAVFYDTSTGFLSVQFRAEVNSINTGNERRDNDLGAKGWFEADRFPFMHFLSKSVTVGDSGQFTLTGDLTIKDVTKTISIKFAKPTRISRDWAGNEQVDYQGSFVLNRREFGVEGGGFWNTIMEDGLMQLSDEVEVELNIHTRRPDYIRRKESGIVDSVSIAILNRMNNKDTAQAFAMVDSLISAGYELKPYVLADLGNVLLKQDKNNESLAVFKKKMRLFPKENDVLNSIGIANLRLKNIQQAKDNFSHMLKVDSLNLRASEYLRILDLN